MKTEVYFVIYVVAFFAIMFGKLTENKIIISIGWLIVIGEIIELIKNNPSEWLLFTISAILIPLFFIMMTHDDDDYEWTIGQRIAGVCSIICAILAVIGLIIALLHENPVEHVDRDSEYIVDIIPLNNLYEIDGIDDPVFVVIDGEVYRYSYIAINGMKRQAFIDTDITYIDDTLSDEETPYLEKLSSYDIIYSTYNKETKEIGTENEVVWYELHIPHGSIIKSNEQSTVCSEANK